MHISRLSKPRIVITMGDPAGIGPEVALKALASSKIFELADFLFIGDSHVVGRLAKSLGLRLKSRMLDLSNVPRASFRYGRIYPSCGKAAIRYLDGAIEILRSGKADALVTAPVNKSAIRAAGLTGFEGHTEYLAKKTGAKDIAMMFVGKGLKVVPVTRHIALKEVPQALSLAKIYQTILLTHRCLKKFFGIKNPRIGVSGLNPHAGEGGRFGSEEDDMIIPAVRRASRHIDGLSGPFPPDVIFYNAFNNRYDAVVAMYHDQALIPFKMLYFRDGVNLTIGLPFIRTSPDHGTAFDIAGKGIADPASMIEAIMLACRLCGRSPIG